MKDIEILTGSLSRTSLPLLKWAPDPIVFVEPQEFDLYREIHPTLRLVKHPRVKMGFSGMMNQLVKYTLDSGKQYFCFTDDDVFGMKYRSDCTQKFQRITGSAVTQRIAEAFQTMKDAGAAQMCVSFAAVSWGVKVPYQSPTGAWGVYLCDAKAVKTVGGFDESLSIFGDWEMSARLIQAGYRCMKTNLLTFEHKMKSMEGGAADVYRDKDAILVACDRVRSRYPHACRVKYVPEHGQHEVRFNWRQLVPGYTKPV